MPESIPYLSVGFDVGTDFTWMSIILPNGILIDKPSKITHSNPQSRELVISKIKEAQEMYFLGSRCFLEPTGIYHIPLLCFLRDGGSDCAIVNPIVTRNSTNMSVGKLHNDKFDSKKVAKVGLDASPRTSVVPDGVVTDLRNLMHDYYYFKDLQSVIVLKLHVGLKVSFLAYLNASGKVITQISLKLLRAYPLAADMLTAPKGELVGTIRGMAHFGETYALTRYDAIYIAAKDAAVFGRVPPGNALRIRLYIEMYKEYQAHLDSILKELCRAVSKLERVPNYNHISFIQTLHDVGFLSTVILIAEMGAFNLFSSSKKLYIYFGLDPGANDPGKFHEDRAHISKWGSSLVRRILHMVATNDLKVDKVTKTPVNPVIHDYYTRKCASKKKGVTVRAVIHKICNTIFVMLRNNKSLKLITLEEHRERYAVGHPESVNAAA